ncbi:MAG: ribonuclease III [Caulobacterales bacterium]
MSGSASTRAARDALVATLGYTFANPALLDEALTHASASEGRAGLAHNERLEFLGDRVLGLVVAETLWASYREVGEGGLAQRLNAIVNRGACAQAARRIGLGPAIRLSAAEDRTGGRDKDAILADACEALIAALYLDGGFDAARAFILSSFADAFEGAQVAPQDPKTALQEWAAARHGTQPRYQVVGRTGPDHAPRFVVEVLVDPMAPAQGEGTSKREAERAAARVLLERECGHE